MSNSVRPHRRQPTRLPHPRDSPGKNTGVGCHFLLQCMKVKSENEVAQSCRTPSDPMDCSPPGSSIHGIFQAKVLEWGAITNIQKHINIWIGRYKTWQKVNSAASWLRIYSCLLSYFTFSVCFKTYIYKKMFLVKNKTSEKSSNPMRLNIITVVSKKTIY